MWLRIGTSGGLLWIRWRTLGFYERREISWLAKRQLVFQEGLCSKSSRNWRTPPVAGKRRTVSFGTRYRQRQSARAAPSRPVIWHSVNLPQASVNEALPTTHSTSVRHRLFFLSVYSKAIRDVHPLCSQSALRTWGCFLKLQVRTLEEQIEMFRSILPRRNQNKRCLSRRK
jgi:hypothetical protein